MSTAIPKEQKLRILIVHGNPMLRLGLRSVLERHEMQIVGETVERERILELVKNECPDVILVDGSLTFRDFCHEYSAAQVVGEIRQVGGRGIFVLVPKVDEENLFQFLMAGAAVYFGDRLEISDLVEKARRVAGGEYLLTEDVVPVRVREQEPEPKMEPLSSVDLFSDGPLTEREIEILEHVMRGMSNKQIGRALSISDQTIKNHITAIISKLEAHDRTECVVIALRLGILSLADAQSFSQNGNAMPPSQTQERQAECVTPLLSAREIEVLGYAVGGMSNKQIGIRLSISIHTVRNHIASVRDKLGVKNRTEAVTTALRLELIPHVAPKSLSGEKEQYALVANA